MDILSIELYGCVVTALVCMALIARRDVTHTSTVVTHSPTPDKEIMSLPGEVS